VAEGMKVEGGKKENADWHNARKRDMSNTTNTEEEITGGRTTKALITQNV